MADENFLNSPFDPKDHNVEEVKAHLDSADQEERDRVLTMEAEGKNRPTVMSYDPAPLDENPDAAEPDPNAPAEETPVTEEDRQAAKDERISVSEKVAAGGEVPEDYDPRTDPMIPSSSLADSVVAELASGDGSPTLQALHDNKPSTDAKDDKSTS
jgi:hypothetical protein